MLQSHCVVMNRHADVIAPMLQVSHSGRTAAEWGGGQVLLDCDPEAAELKGKLGNLPLHTAAEFSGVLWCCGRRLDT